MKPIIGIIPGFDNDRICKLGYQYVEAIESAGAIPILLPPTKSKENFIRNIELCDGFLFTGGVDVDPKHYNEEISPACGDIHPYRDEFELFAFDLIYESKKPILGICRGHQLINVALGGSLYQDMPTDCPGEIAHRQKEAKTEFSHDVEIIENTPLHTLTGKTGMRANSFHHQAIKTLGRDLAVMATASDGTVEAIYSKSDRYLRSYQWHPERIYTVDGDNEIIFTDFIENALKNKEMGR